MQKFYRKLVTLVTLAFFTSTGLLLPARATAATTAGTPATCSLSDYATASGSNPQCATVNVGGVKLTYPKINYQRVTTVSGTAQAGFNASLASGSAATVNLNAAAQLLGVSSSKIANMVTSLPASGSVVFARMAPQTGQLVVQLLKVQKSGSTISVLSAPFTPQHGNMWAASRTFMTAAEKAASTGPGPNPFSRYDQGDNAFHGVTFADATAVVGSAMRYSGATMSVLSMASSRLNQYTTEHGFFRKTITIHVDGYTKPVWYVGLPIEMQPEGVAGAICAANEPHCQPAHRMLPFANFNQWTGGSLPENESLVYQWSHSESSWSVFAFAVLAIVLSFVGGELLLAAGITETGSVGLVSSLLGAGFPAVGIPGAGLLSTATVGGMLASSLVEGLAYLGEQFIFNGATALDSPQSGYSGSIGWQATTPLTPESEQAQALATIEAASQITSPPGGFASAVCTYSGGSGPCPSQNNAFDAAYPLVQPVVTDATNLNFNSAVYVRDTQ